VKSLIGLERGDLQQEKELRQTGPSAQQPSLVVLKVATVTVMPSVPMVSSVDLTTAKTSMRMLTD